MYAAGQGSENPIPLSPQWLLPKPGENKPGALSGVFSYHFHDLCNLLIRIQAYSDRRNAMTLYLLSACSFILIMIKRLELASEYLFLFLFSIIDAGKTSQPKPIIWESLRHHEIVRKW